MKIQIVGLGQFGMFLATHFIDSGCEVVGIDADLTKKAELEKLGGSWGDAVTDARVLSVFPWQIEAVPADGSLVVNVSSVQEPGITSIKKQGVSSERIVSLHPLFGPVGVSKSGWLGKQIIVTKLPHDSRAHALLRTFRDKGVGIDEMSPEEHDEKMLTHALAFFLTELIEVGAAGADPRYLTGSARHMLGLLEFTEKSDNLRRLILSNPALKKRWPAIQKKISEVVVEFELE